MGEEQGSKEERVVSIALLMLSPYFQFPFVDSDKWSVFEWTQNQNKLSN